MALCLAYLLFSTFSSLCPHKVMLTCIIFFHFLVFCTSTLDARVDAEVKFSRGISSRNLPDFEKSNNLLLCEGCGMATISASRMEPRGSSSSSSSSSRIIDGELADRNEHPWLAFLQISDEGANFHCSGSLITKYYVLTAAHCVYGYSVKVNVFLGAHNFQNQRARQYKASKIIIHEHYTQHNSHNDIALLKLERPVLFTRFVAPVCLAGAGDGKVGDSAVVAGWGSVIKPPAQSAYPDKLMEVLLPIKDHDECKELYAGKGREVTDKMVCTLRQGKDACVGDSGGPLIVNKGPAWVQVGVVSFGAGCATKYPGVFTRVSAYLDWISANMKTVIC